MTIGGHSAVLKRVTQTGYQSVESRWPAVIASASGSFEAIYPTMRGIMGAKKKPFTQLRLADVGIAASEFGEAVVRERAIAVGNVDAGAAGHATKYGGGAIQARADFLHQCSWLYDTRRR